MTELIRKKKEQERIEEKEKASNMRTNERESL